MPLAETGIAPRGTETILLVEPEPETRKLAAFMLSKVGYTVLEARNAGEACRTFEEFDGPVDLLLTEAPMSKINGHELAQMLCARAPSLRVLYLSDPDYVRLARRAAAEKGLAFLHRPFTMRLLAGKVRQVLDAPMGKRLTAGGPAF
jgi:DNA-binding response OmpR family regulator